MLKMVRGNYCEQEQLESVVATNGSLFKIDVQPLHGICMGLSAEDTFK